MVDRYPCSEVYIGVGALSTLNHSVRARPKFWTDHGCFCLTQLRTHPWIPASVAVGGFVYNVASGRTREIVVS